MGSTDYTVLAGVRHSLRALNGVIEAGVVTCERRGTWIYYRLDPKTAARIAKLGHLLTAGATREPKKVTAKPALA